MPTNTDTTYFKLRSFARNIILNILGSFSKPQPGVHILNGHRILNEAEPETFRALLQELSRYVRFINFEDAVQKIAQHEQPAEPLVAFTFDDGFTECYDYFCPVLEEFGVNACLFISPNYVEGDDKYIENFNEHIVLTHHKHPMRWSQLKELANHGHIIGAHTMDHYMINTSDEEVLRNQICTCKHIIEEQTGQPCRYFAFPYGKLSEANEKSIEIACSCYPYVFSQSDYKHYFSFSGKVINRRHFEPFWPKRHLFCFLSCKKNFE